MIKIIFLDFDETLYSHKTKSIPESAIDSLNILHDKGIKIFLCSGRSLPEMNDFDLSMLKIDGMIMVNGMLAYDSEFSLIYDIPLSGSTLEKTVKMFNDKKLAMCFVSNNEYYANFVDDFVKKVQNDINSSLPPVKEYSGEKIYLATCFYKNNDEYNEFMKLSNEATITRWHDGGLDIVSKGINKAMGISRILDYYGYSKEEAMCFGDGDNDISMIRYCRYGIAMGNSDDEVKKAADHITEDVDNDGVFLALKHFELI